MKRPPSAPSKKSSNEHVLLTVDINAESRVKVEERPKPELVEAGTRLFLWRFEIGHRAGNVPAH